jgi:deoxyribodipyrimidine photo-lyase
MIKLDEAFTRFTKNNPNILVHGGRMNGLKLLKQALLKQKDYGKDRDYLFYNTTHLSAYIKFGCVSVREVYHSFSQEFGKKSAIIKELFWREFFVNILYCYPEVIGKSYIEKYRKIKWNKSISLFELWKEGKTGFPVVDAGMRELNTTGYMHNRVRMIVASFLVKVLLLDWRLGEKYFSQKLTDYDIASNNGNWQSISSTGADMKPYFRDMNPWIQSQKFDVNTEYIKKWIPELKDVLPKDIHKWYNTYELEKYKDISYPKPIVVYEDQKKKMLELYKNSS